MDNNENVESEDFTPTQEWVKNPKFIRMWLGKEALKDLRREWQNMKNKISSLEQENEELKQRLASWVDQDRL